MRFGAHLSIAKGLPALLAEADGLGLDAIQIFARNPRGRGEAKVAPAEAAAFRRELAKRGWMLVIHAPYYVNLGSGTVNNRRIAGEVTHLDLEKGDQLGADYVVVHLGGPGEGFSIEDGTQNAIANVKQVLARTDAKCMLLLETSAGGKRVGNTFEQLASILKGVGLSKRVGVCLDTCHVFTAGYDVRGRKMKTVLDDFDRIIGLDQLKVVHVNDTEAGLGSGLDRHFHIGQGQIGSPAFKTLLHGKRLKDMTFILETPKGEKKAADKMNLATLRRLAK